MQKGEEASESIILAGRALLVKMLIPLEPCICFKLCILMYFNIVQPLVCKMMTRLHRASFGRSSSFGENAQYSWTKWYILFKFCILMYFDHYPATDMQNGDEASPSIILAGRALLMKMLITLELRGIFVQILYTIVF